MKLYSSLFIFFFSFAVAAQDVSFSFRLVSTPGYLELQSEKGCNWLELTFNLWQNGDPVFINENGMLGSNPGRLEEYKEQSQFLIKIGRMDNALTITAFKGTHWEENKVFCPREYCSIQVNEDSVEEYK